MSGDIRAADRWPKTGPQPAPDRHVTLSLWGSISFSEKELRSTVDPCYFGCEESGWLSFLSLETQPPIPPASLRLSRGSSPSGRPPHRPGTQRPL